MRRKEILDRLLAMADAPYADFQRKLIPNVAPETMIGVRTPALRALAKELIRGGEEGEFLSLLPHEYFDENQLHAFLLSEIRDFDACIREVERFLPCVDNWATCDQLSPRCFGKNKRALLEHMEGWLSSDYPYTVRFGMGMLMAHFLDKDFEPRFLDMVVRAHQEEYYVAMMVAWYFATALSKQYDAALPVLQRGDLPTWIHNKAIQKAIESRRITEEQKAYLRHLKKGR